MIVTLSLKDETHEAYVKHNPTSPNKAMAATLERFAEYGHKRALVLSDEARREIEVLYGKPVDDAEMPAFIKWLKRRASVKVGECEVALNAAQLKRAESNATFWGQSLEKWITDKVHAGLEGVLGR